MSQYFRYPPAGSISLSNYALETGGNLEDIKNILDTGDVAVTGNWLTDAELRASPVPVSGPLTNVELRASAVPVSAASLPLPSGAATETTLLSVDAELVTLNTVDFATETTLASLNSKVTIVDTSDVTVSSSVLPTGAATEVTLASVDTNTSQSAADLATIEAKIASSDVIDAFDYREFTYVGATERINTIVYKTGGSGGTTVATQTFGYDGSDRLTSITTT